MYYFGVNLQKPIDFNIILYMKTLRLALAILITFPVMLSSCVYDNITTSIDHVNTIETLQKNIVGKWEFDESSGKTLNNDSFIEFTNHGTFIYKDASDQPATGTYIVTDYDEIYLKDFGSFTHVKVVDSFLSFTIVSNQKSVKMSARKASFLEKEDKLKLLCQKWEMLPVERGIDSLSYLDRSLLTITSSGTYMTESEHYASASKYITISQWKWHSTIDDRIVYWNEWEGIKENQIYIVIRELTETSLKITDHRNGNFMDLSFKKYQDNED